MRSRPVLVTAALAAMLIWPLLPVVPYDAINTAILALFYLIVTLSLVLLIGLVGQISLAQAAFVGMGAFTSALAIRGFGPVSIHFPFVFLVGTGAGALMAALVGVVALRVRGLYLAVATLILGYVCDQYLFVQPWLVQSQSGTSVPAEVVGRPGTLPYLDLGDAHGLYYVALALAIFCLYSLANLRESRVGRAFAAVRGSEIAAASLGINVVRFKLLGFATAGALAGLAGTLVLLNQRAVEPTQFDFAHSLFFLSIAVVAGLRSLGGAIASALMFALLVGEVFFRIPALADYLDVVTAAILALVLLFFRGGLGALPERLHGLTERFELGARLDRWVIPVLAPVRQLLAASRRPAPAPRDVPAAAPTARRTWLTRLGRPRHIQPAQADHNSMKAGPLDVVGMVDRVVPRREPAEIRELPSTPSQHSTDSVIDGDSIRTMLTAAEGVTSVAGEVGVHGRREPLLLTAAGITVRFGGLTAVSRASIRVGAGEIVGLIGPNGAGKTTLFNSLLGLNQPDEGSVHLYGRDVTTWPVHDRAALGVGRTFQVLQLFGDLSVYDNLLVATHLQNRTGLFGSILVTPAARLRERAARRRVDAVLRLMELEAYADRSAADLPFGVLRLIEVARTLVTGARLVCFDEPASGLDSAETERLIEWFRFLRQIGTTLLVIEHDVSMVVRLCDYIYVLDQGKLICEGTPSHVQRDPHVVASYLGTAIQEAS